MLTYWQKHLILENTKREKGIEVFMLFKFSRCLIMDNDDGDCENITPTASELLSQKSRKIYGSMFSKRI